MLILKALEKEQFCLFLFQALFVQFLRELEASIH